MLNQVINWISNIFQTVKAFSYGDTIIKSGSAASNRLKSVLVQDRSNLNTETLDAMKIELVSVISKYMLINRNSIDIDLQRNGTYMTLISNIPIASVRSRRQRNIIGQKPQKRQSRKTGTQFQA